MFFGSLALISRFCSIRWHSFQPRSLFQVPYFVEGFDTDAYRLAIPEMFDSNSRTRVVFGGSSLLLVVCAILPSAAFGLCWAVVSFRGLVTQMDHLIDLNSYFVLRFHYRLTDDRIHVKLTCGFITLWVFLVFTMLSGELTSFTEPVRIPRSNCRYDRCRVELFSELMGYTDYWSQGYGRALRAYFSSSGETSPLKPTRRCPAEELRTAQHSSTYLAKSILTVLFLNMALCGKKDILNLRTQSLNQRGLLIEERLHLNQSVTQICLRVETPWLQRVMLEQGLFAFVHFGLFQGERIGENLRERDLWDGKSVFHRPKQSFEIKIERLKGILEEHGDTLKSAYAENRMWKSDREFILDLKSQFMSLKMLVIGFKVAILAVLLENFMKQYDRIMYVVHPPR